EPAETACPSLHLPRNDTSAYSINKKRTDILHILEKKQIFFLPYENVCKLFSILLYPLSYFIGLILPLFG
ncbi:MAG TPA: hypothetical protein H9849_01155, partial [Candidatus Anaerobutyricum stercoripullorum]|nr:hypothetical protein [Candidatus Anaerobutyricum stercoripullorum]